MPVLLGDEVEGGDVIYKKWFNIIISEYFGGLRRRGIRPGLLAIIVGHFCVKHGVIHDQN